MSGEENKPSAGWAHLVSELLSFIPKDLREMIGVIGGMWLLISIPILVVHLINNTESPTAQCWHLQDVDGRVFKINACTGKTVELKPERKSATL